MINLEGSPETQSLSIGIPVNDKIGVGLSIVNDIVQVYGGTLEIGVSKLGGAKIIVKLPGNPEQGQQVTES